MFDLLAANFAVVISRPAHVGQRCLPPNQLCHHLWNELRLGDQLVVLVRELVQGIDAARHAVSGGVITTDDQEQQIAKVEKRLQERVAPEDDFKRLMTVPGIGTVLATMIYLETGPIDRFASPGNYASYARCVNSEYSSNGKKKGQGNTKNGNKYLSWAFVEAAHFATRFCPEAKRFYERKKAKANTALATKALAHKLARACYHILKEQEPFDMSRCFAWPMTKTGRVNNGTGTKPSQ